MVLQVSLDTSLSVGMPLVAKTWDEVCIFAVLFQSLFVQIFDVRVLKEVLSVVFSQGNFLYEKLNTFVFLKL